MDKLEIRELARKIRGNLDVLAARPRNWLAADLLTIARVSRITPAAG